MEESIRNLIRFIKLIGSKYIEFMILDREVLGEVRNENILKSSEIESQNDKIEDMKLEIRELER